jgi:hypothetical protein
MATIYGIEVIRIARDNNGNGRYLVHGIDEEVARSLGGRKGRKGTAHEGGWIFQESHTDSGERELQKRVTKAQDDHENEKICRVFGAETFEDSILERGRS